MSVVLVVTGDRVIAGWSAFGSLIFVAPGVASLISALIVRYNSWLLLKGPVISRIKEYEAADAAYQVVQEEASKVRHEAERQRREADRAKQAALLAQQRKRQQYWESLGGVEFERELGKLYRGRGYGVDWTPTSGDQGINIIPKRHEIHRKAGTWALAVEISGMARPMMPLIGRRTGLIVARSGLGEFRLWDDCQQRTLAGLVCASWGETLNCWVGEVVSLGGDGVKPGVEWPAAAPGQRGTGFPKASAWADAV